MAAATVTNRRQNQILGFRRAVTWDTVTFNNNGDTLVIPGIKRIESIDYTPQTGTAIGFTTQFNTPAGSSTITAAYAGGALVGAMQVSGI